MSKFYIEKLSVYGEKEKPSHIEFGDGLNIIYGVSNTGKSCTAACIDYIFGGDDLPFNERRGCLLIQLTIKTENGRISLERVLRKNKIKVSSSDASVPSGEYSVYDKNGGDIGSILLRLIGINCDPKIIKNERYETLRLTWRSFLHTFFINEDDIYKSAPILLPAQNTAKTAAISALLYLISSPDFSCITAKEDKKIREARQKTLNAYINGELNRLSKRKDELNKSRLAQYEPDFIENTIRAVVDRLAATEARIAQELKKSKGTLSKILDARDKLAECDLLLNRYAELASQYTADIKRLGFIVDGEANFNALPAIEKCPFCDGALTENSSPSYTDAANAELARIVTQLNGLDKTQKNLILERDEIQSVLISLTSERNEVEALIKNELQPKAQSLKNALREYRSYIALQKELQIIDGLKARHTTELSDMSKDDDISGQKYKPREHFPASFESDLSAMLFETLKSCRYENLIAAFFSLHDFDVVVNGQKKQHYGKGHKAFLNTVLALAVRRYLSERGKFAPSILIIDSPLLTLKQGVSDAAPESMKSALFKYLIETQKIGQTIIIENEIPDLDYLKDVVTLHKFTKGKEAGRYGLLADVFD